jgi:hypothetical protein
MIEQALADMTPWLKDRQVARLEIFPEGDEIVIRAIMHMDQAERFTQLFVGATGRGPDARTAILRFMEFIEGRRYEGVDQLSIRIAALEADIAGYIESEQTLIRGSAVRISAAILAERERCAKIAEHLIPSGFTGEGKAGNSYAVARDDRARTIAALIRGETP